MAEGRAPPRRSGATPWRSRVRVTSGGDRRPCEEPPHPTLSHGGRGRNNSPLNPSIERRQSAHRRYAMADSRLPSAGFRRQLRREVDRWQSEGLLSADQAQALSQRYRLDDLARESTGNLLAAIYIIGALLIAAGLVSFVAAHWDGIPAFLKVVLIVLAMLLCYGFGVHQWKTSGGAAAPRPRPGHPGDAHLRGEHRPAGPGLPDPRRLLQRIRRVGRRCGGHGLRRREHAGGPDRRGHILHLVLRRRPRG